MTSQADLGAMLVSSDARAIQSLFPEDVIGVTATPDMEGASLLPEEEACIARAVPKRRREFVLGRACAHAALARLGIRGHALIRDGNRAPVWPAGIVGSISHCDGFCGAAVAPRGVILGVGLDAEPAEPLPPELVPRVCTAWELDRIPATPPPGRVDWHRLIFSAKESVYKACYPLVRTFLGFADVEVAIDPADGRFAVRVSPDPVAAALDGKALHGRFVLTDMHVLTGVTILRSGS